MRTFGGFRLGEKFFYGEVIGDEVHILKNPYWIGLEPTRAARRTFVAIGSNDRAALGFCPEATLADLAQMLATPLGDFKIQRALNLDGGSSSAFWLKRKDGSALSSFDRQVRCESLAPRFFFFLSRRHKSRRRNGASCRRAMKSLPRPVSCIDMSILETLKRATPRLSILRSFPQSCASCESSTMRTARAIWLRPCVARIFSRE